MKISDIPLEVMMHFRKGVAIPACPLALDANLKIDERRQKALVRYYQAAGSGGLAVAVHSTQFEVHDDPTGLLEPLLRLVAKTLDEGSGFSSKPMLRVAGICGKTAQALKEAKLAESLGYHAGLLSLTALKAESVEALIAHAQKVSEILPVFGFYLQPSVGGRVLPFEFWRRFVDIPNVIGIKMAPFNRYQTLDVARALHESGRQQEITLYTGNDDNIVADLVTPLKFEAKAGTREIRIAGGLLGHWAVWTKKAVELMDEIRRLREGGGTVPPELLTRGAQITDSNAAFFDAANGFAGCIPGIHEVLRRQGLLADLSFLDPHIKLSPGQKEEIDRVYAAYPHLSDDGYVKAYLPSWLDG